MTNDKCYAVLDSYCSTLEFDLTEKDNRIQLLRQLPISSSDYTTLRVSDDISAEIIEVCGDGTILHRDSRNARFFDCGSRVEFHWSLRGIQAVKEAMPKEEECPEKEPFHDGVIKAGNYDYIIEKGRVVDCKVNKARYIKAGVYHNTSICIDEDGCVTQLAQGNPLRTGTVCQTCGE